MKVNIGPYKNWYGPYQAVAFLKHFGVSEAARDKFAEWLPAAPFEWFASLRDRHIEVRIDPHDTYSMDHTIALIIHPMLVQLKATKHSSPCVDDEDVPDHLKKAAGIPGKNEWDTDSLFHERWNYVIDEMVWAFEQVIADDDTKFFNGGDFDRAKYHAHNDRINNGTRLFGKYYRGLWD